MIKFSKIHGFNKVVKHARQHPDRYGGPIVFKGTTKLHGTNAGVRVSVGGDVTPQSRNRTLTLDADNCGFAAFAMGDGRRSFFTETARMIGQRHAHKGDVVLYGEWCGPGIQRGCAVNKMHDKHLVLFAAALVGVDDEKRYVPLPEVDYHVAPELRVRSVHEGPEWTLRVNLLDRECCTRAADLLNGWTEAVDKQCPWSMRVFGIDGVGEGIVWRPIGDRESDSDLFFKVKGPSHGEKGAAKKATTAAPNLESIDRFVSFAVTEARCSQAVEYLREMGKPIEMRSTGDYLKRISEDVLAECSDELAANGLEWKQAAKAVTSEALIHWKRVAA